MPLIKSKSPEAFKKNISAEIKSGKPMKQSVAIAYSVKRSAKKADGGDVTQDKKLIKKAFSLHDQQQHEDKKTNLSKLKSGGMLQSVNEDKNPGLAKLPTEVRNKMGYMKNGGLYANINAKRERISQGSGEKMRKVGSEGAPTSKNFKEAAKTAKVKHGGGVQNP